MFDQAIEKSNYLLPKLRVASTLADKSMSRKHTNVSDLSLSKPTYHYVNKSPQYFRRRELKEYLQPKSLHVTHDMEDKKQQERKKLQNKQILLKAYEMRMKKYEKFEIDMYRRPDENNILTDTNYSRFRRTRYLTKLISRKPM